MNWLYRRGFLDQDSGTFGTAGGPGRGAEIASTAWWVDFSNFFEGVGALGGGNVTLTAGRDIANVDAVIPTNARMPKGTPNPDALVELGGGDLVVRAGRDQFGVNTSLDSFIAGALQKDLPVRMINHAGAPHAFDLFEDSEATREIIREILRFMQFHLIGPVLADRPGL
jgi:hypothetical protein